MTRRAVKRPSVMVLVALLAGVPVVARAQNVLPVPLRPGLAGSNGAAVEPEELVSPDSPRAAVTRFLDHARARRWQEAARFLDLTRDQETEGPRLAQQLIAVLDRHVWLEPASLSPNPEGATADGLPARIDEVGQVPGTQGLPEPVRLSRHEFGEGARWVFTRQTVARVPGWYARLEGRWMREHLPSWMLRLGPRNLLGWQWIALPLVALVALGLARVAATLLLRAVSRAARRVWPEADEGLQARGRGPATLLLMVPTLGAGVGFLGLYRPAEAFVAGVLRAMFALTLFWGLWRSVGLLTQAVLGTAWARARPGSVTLVPLGGRALKVVLVALAVTAVLSSLGYPVASLVAGLGIGGLALALAAQKTGEHLLGSVAIGLDQPFRVGDLVKVEDHTGTIESVGLRSTRMRTLDRTVVTIPNGKLADLRVENFTARDRYYFHCRLGLATEATPESLRALLEALRTFLAEHPQRADDVPTVCVREVNTEAVVLEVQAWFRAESVDEFVALRTELHLELLEAIPRHGLALAAPARALARALRA